MAAEQTPITDEVRRAQLALLRALTPGQRVERQARLLEQLEQIRRAGAVAKRREAQ